VPILSAQYSRYFTSHLLWDAALSGLLPEKLIKSERLTLLLPKGCIPKCRHCAERGTSDKAISSLNEEIASPAPTHQSPKAESMTLRHFGMHPTKSYLSEIELKELNLLVEQYLVFAETQVLLHRPMYMEDWAGKLHDIFTINQKEIKTDAEIPKGFLPDSPFKNRSQ
jgi:hypothetical protein